MEVGIFIPCYVDQLFPETGLNMVKVLERAKMRPKYNPAQTCCGQVAFNSGYVDQAKHMANKFVKDFMGYKVVVGPSASCAGMVKNYYPMMLDNSVLHNENRHLGKKIYEFSDFLVNVAKVTDLGCSLNTTVTIHDSCAALREYKLGDEPRQLLSNVSGLKIVEMKDRDVCCGFGGTFSVKHEAISTAMAQQKIENALKTGAEYIVSTEVSCLLHLDSYIKKNNLGIKTIHIADLLAMSLPK